MKWQLLWSWSVVACLALGPAAVAAPADDREYTVYMVLWRGYTPSDDGFRDYLESRHLKVKYVVRNIARQPEAAPAIVQEIKKVKPDVVYAWGLGAAEGLLGHLDEVAAHPEKYLTDIPVVACATVDPVAGRLSEAWESTGRNFTGVSQVAPIAAQVNAMKLYDDNIKRLAVLYNPAEESPTAAVESLRIEAKRNGFTLLEYPLPLDHGSPRTDQIPLVMREIAQHKPDFLYLGPDAYIVQNRDIVTEQATLNHLPTFAAGELLVRDGSALVGLVSRYYNFGQYCGYKAYEIMVEHRDPKTIPFDTLKKFSYVVNRSTARRLGYYPPLPIVNFIEITDGHGE